MMISLAVLSKPCFDAYESLIHIVLYYQVLLYYFFTQSFTNYYAIDIHKHGNNHNFAKFSMEIPSPVSVHPCCYYFLKIIAGTSCLQPSLKDKRENFSDEI